VVKYFLQKIRLLSNARKEPYLLFYNILGFYPRNIFLYQQALLHKSTQQKDNHGHCINNERLEFLGDSVLGTIVSDILYDMFEEESEGFLTNTRSKIVQRESLNHLALEIGLDKLIVFSNNTNLFGTNIYGNAFEALIGAIYLDQGYDKCRKFIETRIIKRLIDVEKVAKKEVNFKSRLIEWGQKYKIDVQFEVIEEYINSENKPVFQTQILINNQNAGIGVGSSKKESQQKASKTALKKIKETPKFWENKITEPEPAQNLVENDLVSEQ